MKLKWERLEPGLYTWGPQTRIQRQISRGFRYNETVWVVYHKGKSFPMAYDTLREAKEAFVRHLEKELQ